MDGLGFSSSEKSKSQISPPFPPSSSGGQAQNVTERVMWQASSLWGEREHRCQNANANPRLSFSLQDIAENGCAPTPEEQLPKTAPSPLVEAKDPKLREDRRPITVHFGQVCTLALLPVCLGFFLIFVFSSSCSTCSRQCFISVLFGSAAPRRFSHL